MMDDPGITIKPIPITTGERVEIKYKGLLAKEELTRYIYMPDLVLIISGKVQWILRWKKMMSVGKLIVQ